MSTATLPRQIAKIREGSATIFREVQHHEPLVTPSYDVATGTTRDLTEHRPDTVAWEFIANPALEMRGLRALCWPDAFDPREPSKIHDEYEHFLAQGFEATAARLAGLAKLEPRRDPKPIFDLGPIYVARAPRMVPYGGPAELRAYLKRHSQGDFGHGDLRDVTLTADNRLVPPLYGQLVMNACAIEGDAAMLVKSAYQHRWEPTRGVEELRIWTHVGHCTIVWSSR